MAWDKISHHSTDLPAMTRARPLLAQIGVLHALVVEQGVGPVAFASRPQDA
jgi:hypothetical protein